VTAAGSVVLDLDLERRGEQITVRGRARVDAEEVCARCARPLTHPLEAEILVYADRRGQDDPRDEVALEQEGSVHYHDGSELDLAGPIREAIILEEPPLVLCRPDCRGLCPVCGQDRNEGTCSCAPAGEDPRWEALKKLRESGTTRGDTE
jgi:uncharacterized protein